MSKREYQQPNRPAHQHGCGKRMLELWAILFWHREHSARQKHAPELKLFGIIKPRRARKLRARCVSSSVA